MKLNNKGFAISGILYAVMILFLTLVVSLLALLSNRKLVLDKYKKEIKENLNSSIETYNARIQLAENTNYIHMTEEELEEYDYKSQISGCLSNGEHDPELFTLCDFTEADITNLLNYKIYTKSGTEIISFGFDKIQSSDGFKTSRAYYNYYEKDENGNYLLDSTNQNLKISKKYLDINDENIFLVKYYIVDNHNILAKEVSRNLIIDKYDKYVNVTTSYFKVGMSLLNSYNYQGNASSYEYVSGSLNKNNALLNYSIYNSKDEKITFYEENGNWYYRNNKNEVISLNDNDEKFRVRYYTGTSERPTSEIKYAYFTIE